MKETRLGYTAPEITLIEVSSLGRICEGSPMGTETIVATTIDWDD